jgi:predicted  nucleic acid-binding Zn-ribbon protein
MMRISITTLLLLSLVGNIRAQDSVSSKLEKEISSLKNRIQLLETRQTNTDQKITGVVSSIPELRTNIGSLSSKVDSTGNIINTTDSVLTHKILQTGKESDTKINSVSEKVSNRTLWGIIGVLAALLLSLLMYFFIRKQVSKDKSAVEDQIIKTRKSIEEEQVQVNTKLAELYNGQMELLKAERQNKPAAVNAEVDHSLVLKVADQITKMQMYLSRMDSKVRGFASLNIAVNNVVDNIKANGYDIIDHFNKPFNEGMNMDATMELDPSLDAGVQIIKRVIKPEIHFNNKLIQRAQVIVATGE